MVIAHNDLSLVIIEGCLSLLDAGNIDARSISPNHRRMNLGGFGQVGHPDVQTCSD